MKFQNPMNPDRWRRIAARFRRPILLGAFVTTLVGATLTTADPRESVLAALGFPFLVAAGILFGWAAWAAVEPGAGAPRQFSLADRLMHRLTFGGRAVPLFPLFGVGIVLADLAYNLILSATPAIQTEDTIVLLAAATLVAYPLVPRSFSRERDFALLFFACLNAMLVVPLLIARAYYADFEHSVDVYSWVALAPETSAILQLIGVPNTVHAVVGSSAPGLTFTPQRLPLQVTVVISTACSGIYSFGIFASAFVAFVLTEYRSLSRGVWLLLGLGFLTAYIANVLRMVVIVLIGYYADTAESDLQNMLIAHSYAGWLIFVGWLTPFWAALLRFRPDDRTLAVTANQHERQGKQLTVCAICSEPLTPLVVATRCGCGSYSHNRCLARTGECPRCGRTPEAEGHQAPI